MDEIVEDVSNWIRILACRKVGKSEFSLKFLSKTPIVHLVVGVSTETYNFKLKISSLVFRPETKL